MNMSVVMQYSDDPQAFANALIDASENPEKLAIMGKNSKKLAIERFDRKKLSSIG